MSADAGGTVVQRLGSRIADVVERWMPSPFLFAIILSYVVFLGGIVIEGAGPGAMVGYWYDGFWTLLTFAMQMVLICLSVYAIMCINCRRPHISVEQCSLRRHYS